MQDVVEATRAGLAAELGPHLVKLKENQFDQASYIKTALEITRLVGSLINVEYQNVPSIRTKQKNISNTFLKIEWVQPPSPSSTSEKGRNYSAQDSKKYLEQSLGQYTVFNSAYDIEIEAKKSIRPAQLAIYQHELSEEIAKLNIPWGKLTRSYQNIFPTKTLKRWETTQTEGLIDRRYLTRIATAPPETPAAPASKTSTKPRGRVIKKTVSPTSADEIDPDTGAVLNFTPADSDVAAPPETEENKEVPTNSEESVPEDEMTDVGMQNKKLPKRDETADSVLPIQNNFDSQQTDFSSNAAKENSDNISNIESEQGVKK